MFIDGFSPKQSKMCFCIVSMRFVFPFLVFFIFLLAGTFNAEPLLVLRGRCDDPNTKPVIPVVTAITSYHGTAIIRFVTSRANPDLVSPLISNHVSTDGLSYHAADRCFDGGGRREYRGRGN